MQAGNAASGRGVSQCDRILNVLKDGRPHRMEEIHQRAGFCRLNSRVSELRARGYRIVCDKTGGQYVYQLLSPLEAQPSSPQALLGSGDVESGCASSGADTSRLLPPGSLGGDGAAQLSLLEVAA